MLTETAGELYSPGNHLKDNSGMNMHNAMYSKMPGTLRNEMYFRGVKSKKAEAVAKSWKVKPSKILKVKPFKIFSGNNANGFVFRAEF